MDSLIDDFFKKELIPNLECSRFIIEIKYPKNKSLNLQVWIQKFFFSETAVDSSSTNTNNSTQTI